MTPIDDPTVSIEQSRNDPAHAALIAIQEVMFVGSAKEGCDSTWRDRSVKHHLEKAKNHIELAFLMYCGAIPEDKEGWEVHLRNGLTRAAMVLSQR